MKVMKKYWFSRYLVRVGQFSLKNFSFFSKWREMYEKMWVLQLSSKSLTIFIEKALVFRSKEVKCLKKKHWFYMYPAKVGQ